MDRAFLAVKKAGMGQRVDPHAEGADPDPMRRFPPEQVVEAGGGLPAQVRSADHDQRIARAPSGL